MNFDLNVLFGGIFDIKHVFVEIVIGVNGKDSIARFFIQWNLSVTTTSVIKLITCDLFSYVF